MGVQGRQEPRVNNQSSDRIRQQHRTDNNPLCLALPFGARRRDGARTEDVPTGDGQEDRQGPLQLQHQQECRRDGKPSIRSPDAFSSSRYALTLSPGDTQMFLDYIVFMQTCADTYSTVDLHELND